MRKHAWALANLAIGAIAVIASYLVIVHRQDIVDWWVLRGYTAPANIQQLADQDSLQGRGRDMFYVSEPAVEASASFNEHCSSTGEKTIVLGCYVNQHIYVYDVTDARLAGVQQVTAAHEMLHAAYERLDTATKNQVNAWLQAELNTVKDEHLTNLIKLYNRSEPGELMNEMHSILGTEYSNLSPELENYYKQYFGDRSKVVDYSNQYKAAFTAAQDKITQLEDRLNSLKQQIDTLTAEVEQKKSELDQQQAQLNSLRGNPAAYNQAVPAYNQDVNAYNALVVQLRGMIADYNNLVTEHNNEAAAQNDLYHSLDSHYQTVN